MTARAVFTGLALALLLGAACAGTGWMQNRLVFLPTTYPGGAWDIEGTPLREVWFESADGTRLHGWYLAPPEATAAVVYAHGNAGNLSHRRGVAFDLAAMGASVLLFDYRGYGRSEGRPDVAGAFADTEAARDWLAAEEGLARDQVVLHGRSLGGAFVGALAGRDGARALVLESTFASLREIGEVHYPGWMVSLLLRDDVSEHGAVTDYRGPLLMTHGDRDRIVPMELGRRLFERLAADDGVDRRWVEEPGASHNAPPSPATRAALAGFLAALPPLPEG